MTSLQPTDAAQRRTVPMFPGSLILSQISVNGIADRWEKSCSCRGIWKIPTNMNNSMKMSSQDVLLHVTYYSRTCD